MFTALSKLQNKDKEFREVYFKYIQAIAILVVPLGIGMFMYRKLITLILLGSQWTEAANFIGLWSLTSSVCLVWGTYCSGIYNAKGKPIFSFVAQILHLIVLVPVLFISAQKGFEILYISRSLVRLEFVLVQLVIIKIFFKISPLKLIGKTIPAFIGSMVMCIASIGLEKISHSILWQLISVGICIIVYFFTLRILFKGIITEAFETLGFDIRNLLEKLRR